MSDASSISDLCQDALATVVGFIATANDVAAAACVCSTWRTHAVTAIDRRLKNAVNSAEADAWRRHGCLIITVMEPRQRLRLHSRLERRLSEWQASPPTTLSKSGSRGRWQMAKGCVSPVLHVWSPRAPRLERRSWSIFTILLIKTGEKYGTCPVNGVNAVSFGEQQLTLCEALLRKHANSVDHVLKELELRCQCGSISARREVWRH